MNKLIAGAVFGAIAVTAGGAVAGYRMLDKPGVEVISATAMSRSTRTSRQDCHDEQVTRTKTPRDSDRLAGTGLGAVVGGLLGHEVGGGNGKVLATVAGAAAGGYAGNQIEEKVQRGNTYTATERRCVTAYDTHEDPDGYEVTYELDGTRHRVHMDHDPGKTLPIKDGRVVTD